MGKVVERKLSSPITSKLNEEIEIGCLNRVTRLGLQIATHRDKRKKNNHNNNKDNDLHSVIYNNK